MERNAKDLRARDRRVFGWALGVAVALHGAALVFWPAFHAEPLSGSPTTLASDDTAAAAAQASLVDLSFGPPSISLGDGSVVQEPPGRHLETSRLVPRPEECDEPVTFDRGPLRGTIRLRLDATGHAHVVGVVESTGTECGDAVMTDVAGDLWYRWLPDERFRPPVDLTQPVTIQEAAR